MTSIAIIADPQVPDLSGYASQLSEQMSIPFAQDNPDEYELLLAVTPDRMELRSNGRDRISPVYVDFIGGRLSHRRNMGGLSHQMVARAIGYKGIPLRVCDATTGLGRDMFLMACLGCQVTAVERSPVIAALLNDGLRRAMSDQGTAEILHERVTLIQGDAIALLRGLMSEHSFNAIYIDTMFPPTGKSALAKKEMRICRLITGEDIDAGELLTAALDQLPDRVVVKRWLRSPALLDHPHITYKGKTIRYDVYLPRLHHNK